MTIALSVPQHGAVSAICLLLMLSTACQQPLQKKVLFIGIDGVRVDILQDVSTPRLDSLVSQGWITQSSQGDAPTVSGPMWSSLLTGVWPAKHGVMGNDFTDNQYDDYPDFLTRIEGIDTTFSTLSVTDWPPLSQPVDGGPLLGEKIDDKVFFNGDELGYRSADELSVLAAVEYLENRSVDAAFVYLGNLDVVGHDTSSLSAEYRRSIAEVDGQVGQLVRAIRQRASFEQEDWLILVITDHGRRDDGGHGGTSLLETTTFYIASGIAASVRPPESIAPVDVAVTTLAHLGIEADASWDLDGKIVGLR
jgi:predicted AlkP superfamily pyrophosphatase or phosphodiesterase